MKKPTHQLTRRGKDYALDTDNAAFIQSSVLSAALNHKLENAKPYGGVAKAVVESHFRILQAEFHALIPGYVGKKSGRRGSHRCWPCALLVEEDTPR